MLNVELFYVSSELLSDCKEALINFKTLNTTCGNFTISGSIAYNDVKSSIYISHVDYCGEENNDLYNKFECVLYEKNGDIDRKVTSFNYEDEEKITLDEFLKTVTIKVDDYKNTCSKYSSDSLYLSVNAIDGDTIITYKIPLKLIYKLILCI